MGTKIIAMYLPQYHSIPENDMWWGEGYTDWVAVKNAKPLYRGHEQPRVPLNDNYYDLSQVDSIRRQAEMANQYGVYGFGIYHYWFSSEKILLDKPAKILLDNQDISTHFFFMWDNGSWKRTWSNVKFSNSWAPLYEDKLQGPGILAELKYGDESEWEKHFEYLLPFFCDDRYIKVDNKPLFGIFNQNNNSDVLREMFRFWDDCARQHGFSGISIVGKSNSSNIKVADYQFDYEPATHAWVGKNNIQKLLWRIKDIIRTKRGGLRTYNYYEVWDRIIKDTKKDKSYFASGFVRYDDTPRRGKNSAIVQGESPQAFGGYLKRLLQKSREYEKEFLFLTAWNEWGEGAYLEPDSLNGYEYLLELKNAVTGNGDDR